MDTAPHILVVDDEPAVCSLLRRGLEAEGYAVSEAANQAALMLCLERQTVDLITLDLNLGNDDGLTIARSVRVSRNIPIIMITGKVTTEDRIIGLESGADDYIAKPFSMREVVLRVRSVLGRYGPIEAAPTEAPSLLAMLRARHHRLAIERKGIRELIEITDLLYRSLTPQQRGRAEHRLGPMFKQLGLEPGSARHTPQ